MAMLAIAMDNKENVFNAARDGNLVVLKVGFTVHRHRGRCRLCVREENVCWFVVASDNAWMRWVQGNSYS